MLSGYDLGFASSTCGHAMVDELDAESESDLAEWHGMGWKAPPGILESALLNKQKANGA